MLRAAGIASTSARHFVRSQQIAPRFLSATAVSGSDNSSIEQFDPSKWFPEVKDLSIRAELNKIREHESEILSLLDQQSDPIDWDKWAQEISYPGLIDEMKKAYDAIPIPNFEEQAKESEAQIEQTFEPIIKKFEQIAKEKEEEIANLEKRIDETTFLRDNIENLTIDEFLEKYPTVKESIEKDIRENKWFVSDA